MGLHGELPAADLKTVFGLPIALFERLPSQQEVPVMRVQVLPEIFKGFRERVEGLPAGSRDVGGLRHLLQLPGQ